MLPFQFQPLVNIYDSDNVVVVEETNPAFEILNDDISLAGNYLNNRQKEMRIESES